MRHNYLCIAAILSSALLGDALLYAGDASAEGPVTTEHSPVLVLNMRSYRWRLPEFRMAGKNAYVLVQIENTHDHSLEMHMSCRTPEGKIPGLSGYHSISPGKFLKVDTRRLRDPMQRGDGVKVRCVFRADSSAKVKAWVYDSEARRARRGADPRTAVQG